MDTEIPPLLPPDQMPLVKTQADLHRHWRALMGELGFGREQLWFQLFDDEGRALPVIQQVEDPPPSPEDEHLVGLMKVCHMALDRFAPDGKVAFLWARPGPAGIHASDRAWADALLKAAQQFDVAIHPVHLANDHEVRAFTADDETGPL